MASVAVMAAPSLAATVIPGPADASRVEQRAPNITPSPALEPASKPMHVLPNEQPPEASKKVILTLHEVRIQGMTVFTPAQVEDIYKPFLDHVITLDTAWVIAEKITERYRDQGYFLTFVTVPAQEVKNGVLTLAVTEGYIGKVTLDDGLAERRVVKSWMARLQSYRPLKSDQLESVLLQLNDLPGVSLRAVLEPLPGAKDGAVKLTLVPEKTQGHGQVSVDNNGSRFLGPYEMSAQYATALLPLQETSVSLMTTLPMDELQYGSLHHEIALFPALNLELYGGDTYANPGYKLKVQDIKSDSISLGVGVNYKIIRQRQENLTARLALESRDTTSDILGTPLTRDYIRAARAKLSYETADRWNGSDSAFFTLSQGLNIDGASQKGDLNLSRAEATPDFTKVELQLARLQPLSDSWNLATSFSGQTASGPLYSSEEFGYGGQAFGRAYDDSEISGDQGIAGSAELSYWGLPTYDGFAATPYSFYDIGTVWNFDRGQAPEASGSSAGGGVRWNSEFGISGNLGFAFPLTRAVANPLQGNGKDPRYIMQLSYGF